MTLSLKRRDAWLKLLLGGALAVWLLLGVALVVLGMTDYLWFIRVSGYGLLCICLILGSSAKEPRTRKQVKWFLVRVGVAAILGLALAAFYQYYLT